MEDNIINSWLKCYMIGPMETTAKNDCGRGWRTRLTKRLSDLVDSENNPIYVFDPTLEETNKTGFKPKILHHKIGGWLSCGRDDLVSKYGRLIWKGKTFIEKTEEGKARLVHIMGDCDYVKHSNFLIAYMEAYDEPCGTFMEVGIALDHNIPVYVIQSMAKKDYRGSFSQAVLGGGGGYFKNETELVEFLKKKYGLKKRK